MCCSTYKTVQIFLRDVEINVYADKTIDLKLFDKVTCHSAVDVTFDLALDLYARGVVWGVAVLIGAD